MQIALKQRTSDWLKTRVGSTLTRSILTLACGMLAGRVVLYGSLYPASTSFLTAAAVTGLPLPIAALGCVLGIMSKGVADISVATFLPMSLAFFAGVIFRISGRKVGIWTGVIIAGMARLAAIFVVTIDSSQIIMGLIDVGFTMALHIAFYGLIVLLYREEYGEGGIISGAIALGVICAGVPPLMIGSFYLPMYVGLTICCIAAMVGGSGVGCAAGFAAGGMMVLGGLLSPMTVAGLGFCGLLCGVFKEFKKPGAVMGIVLGVPLTGIIMDGSPWELAGILTLGFAVVTVIMLPNKFYKNATKRLIKEGADFKTLSQIRIARENIVKKLKRFSGCLTELSQVFDEISTTPQGLSGGEMAPLIETVTTQVCRTCDKKGNCWGSNLFTTWDCFLTTLSISGDKGSLKADDFPKSFRDYCTYFDRVLTSLLAGWELFKSRSGYARQIDESRALVGMQLSGVADVVSELADGLDIDMRFTGSEMLPLKQALRDIGLNAYHVSVFDDANSVSHVKLLIRGCNGKLLCTGMGEKIISTILGAPYKKVGVGCSGGRDICSVEYIKQGKLRLLTGMAQRPASGSICGDSICCRALSENDHLIALSDGMGSGTRASLQSESTIGLLCTLREAGFSGDLIFRTINTVLLVRSENESFATVDMCLINLSDGQSQFIKIGAAPSFVVHDGEITMMVTPSLPLGIVESVNPATIERKLYENDIIILMSDGVSSDGEWVLEELPKLLNLSPGDMARKLLVLSEEYEQHVDDRSVIVSQIKASSDKALTAVTRKNSKVNWEDKVQ